MAEYIECITKHRAKHFVCEFCNEHCGDDPCEPSDCEWMAAVESEPAADVVEVQKELRKVVTRLHNEYERAKKLSFVRNPLAYALYRVWKYVDGGDAG